MRIVKLKIGNFRGIKECDLIFTSQTVLVGDNNTGKSTILEAIDLVLGPERLSRRPIIDEHDFFVGDYLDKDGKPITITIEVTITDLNNEQLAHFINNIEWWDDTNKSLLEEPPPEKTDDDDVVPALRVGFRGYYDSDEDDFIGETYYLSPVLDDGRYSMFRTSDKRKCGFLLLRTLRTGSRALSLERGSLLDIILKLKELKPQMWEDVLLELRGIYVASKPELGISEILESVQSALREIVPIECGDSPTIRVSQLTREHLRQILTVFMGTGDLNGEGKEYFAPFQHQGTGTINTLVLSLLTIIAELKQNVIFAMEEPEIAIPPHTQKRIIRSVINKSSQAIFTTHSPYVLEEFDPSQIVVIGRKNGILKGYSAQMSEKPKNFRTEVKHKYCEALLARRVLIVEGRTEYDVFSKVSEMLELKNPTKYSSIEGLGIAVINAESDSFVAKLGAYFRNLGKTTYAIFDKQSPENSIKISESVDFAFESPEKGFESLIANHIDKQAIKRFASQIPEESWPISIAKINNDTTNDDLIKNIMEYFKKQKGKGAIADCLLSCEENEIPSYILDTLHSIRNSVKSVSKIEFQVEDLMNE